MAKTYIKNITVTQLNERFIPLVAFRLKLFIKLELPNTSQTGERLADT
jgi:hypothetical protein